MFALPFELFSAMINNLVIKSFTKFFSLPGDVTVAVTVDVSEPIVEHSLFRFRLEEVPKLKQGKHLDFPDIYRIV